MKKIVKNYKCVCNNCKDFEKRASGTCNGGFGVCEAFLAEQEMKRLVRLEREYGASLND